MLYRQTLLQKHLWNKLKEMGMQLEVMKTFLGELKDATDYFNTGFGENELTGFPVVINTEASIKETYGEGRMAAFKGPDLVDGPVDDPVKEKNLYECMR